MATLNSWQKVSRVLGGDWGDGANGSATISSDPNTRATITGTATSTSATAGSTSFSNGDLVVLHQTQGTGVGQWEVNLVASGGGTTSLVMSMPLQYTYGTGAQIIKVPRYTTATVSAHSVTAWNGTTGGVEVVLAKTSITVSGALNGVGLGYRGGGSINPSSVGTGGQGEGLTGRGSQPSSGTTSANGIGGGGGNGSNGSDGGGGGGGGHVTAGSNGGGPFGNPGTGGGTGGSSSDLVTITLGGAGAAGGKGSFDGQSGTGGSGGAIFILISRSVTLSSSVTVTGSNGGNHNSGNSGGGGGGAGGSVLVVARDATLGTNNIVSSTSTGGLWSNGGGVGGTGGVGRIAVHHSGTVTGTTNPTFNDVTDVNLRDISGGSFIFNLL